MTRRSLALILLLVVVAVAAARLLRRREPTGAVAAPSRRDVMTASGLDIPPTAGREQAAVIERLRQAAGEAVAPAQVTVDDPQDETIVPPELPPPTFLWHDGSPQADAWLVEVTFANGSERLDVLVKGEPLPEGTIDKRCLSEHDEIYKPTPYQASARSWKPDPALWSALKERAASDEASVVFHGYRKAEPGRILSRGRVRLTTAHDPVGAPIFYRDVPLMPSPGEEGVLEPLAPGALPLVTWWLRDIGRTESRALLTGVTTCAACHSFAADGRTMGMDLGGPQGRRGAYALVPVATRVSLGDGDVIRWDAFPGKPRRSTSAGFLSRVSPDGRHVVSTVNEQLYVQSFRSTRFSQAFYPTRGILAVYARATGAITALPGADDPAFVHCDAVFTPDGRTLVFARAAARDASVRGRPKATQAGDPNETPIQYDLYKMPFEDGRGGTPRPLAGASDNGMSNSFPEVSPDGRFIVFVQAKNGQALRPDGKLYLVPIEGGRPRLMRCNQPLMNSWHSFSPNGRWMVFSSKGNTPYTQMFLTHIDEEGNDSPAVLIENSTAANRAVNLPVFVNLPYDDFTGIDVPAVDHAPRPITQTSSPPHRPDFRP